MAFYHPDATLESPLVCHLLGTGEGVVRGREAIADFVGNHVFPHQPPQRRRFRGPCSPTETASPGSTPA